MRNLTEAITNSPIFRGMKPEHLALLEALTEDATEVEFKPGDVIFREGDPANQVFLIESGEITLEAHEPGVGTVSVETLTAGQVFGWSWLFPPFAWHFHARAAGLTRIIALSGARLLVTAEKNPDFGYELMKRMAQIAIRRLQSTRRQLVAARSEPAGKA